MKKWTAIYGAALVFWIWLSWSQLRTALHVSLNADSAADRHASISWMAELAASVWISGAIVVLIVLAGLIQGWHRYRAGGMRAFVGLLLGAAAAWLGLGLVVVSLFCHLGVVRAAAAWILAIPALVIMAILTPAKVGAKGTINTP